MSAVGREQSLLNAHAQSKAAGGGWRGWLSRLSIARKLQGILLANCLVVCGLLLVIGISHKAIDGVRAYVSGEGLWSKGQKAAVYHLSRYASMGLEEEYAKYQQHIAVPLDMRKARQAMEQARPDQPAARRAFVSSGIPEHDVDNMIWLFRNFRAVPELKQAIGIWREGDYWISQLQRLADELQLQVASGALTADQRLDYLRRIEIINARLTPLELAFSRVLSEGAHTVHSLLVPGIIGIAIVLLILGWWFSTSLTRDIHSGIAKLREGAIRVADGDLSHHITIHNQNELGELAHAFNDMVRLRHKAETALERDRSFLRVTLENLAEAVIACDEQGQLWLFNRAARELHGLPAEAIPPSEWASHYKLFKADGETLCALEDIPLYRALKGERVLGSEMIIAPERKSPHVVLANAQSLLSETGEIIGAVVTLHDVTERREAEQALAVRARQLEISNTELERRNVELRRLYQAEAASAAKSQFLATMSHEIRTPLHGILGLLEVFKTDNLNAEQHNDLLLMRHSGRALQHLINDILDLAKIEAGRMELEHQVISLSQLGTAVKGALQQNAKDRRVQLQLHYDEKLPGHVLGDEGRLTQILLNLGSNAIKFTEAGGKVEIRLRLMTCQNAHACLRFEVQDSGIGIDEEAQQRIFDNFVQASSSTTRRFGGTGLGLAICKGLVNQMGGTIGCNSTPGQGSTFWFEIPAEVTDAEDEAEDAVEIVEARAQGERFPPGPPAMILVAEDNPVNQAVIRHQLERYNCEVTVVDDGQEALEALEQHQYDLLITDLQMPRMSGNELTQQIRHQEAGQDENAKSRLTIIGLTANAQKQTLNQCLNQGMDATLVKPLSLARLDTALRHWLRRETDESSETSSTEA